MTADLFGSGFGGLQGAALLLQDLAQNDGQAGDGSDHGAQNLGVQGILAGQFGDLGDLVHGQDLAFHEAGLDLKLAVGTDCVLADLLCYSLFNDLCYNGIESVGLVGKGALIVQKFIPSDIKPYPTNANDWKRLNEYSGKETDGVHTVNFAEIYDPAEYYYEPFTVYTPNGNDLSNGVFVRMAVISMVLDGKL